MEWTSNICKEKLLNPIDLRNWAMIFLKKDEPLAEETFKIMRNFGPKFGMKVEEPQM